MPKGIYKRKINQGFQKGHPVYTTKGDFKKGQIPWNKGKPMSEETRLRVSAARKGHIHSGNFKKGIKRPEWSGENHPRWKGGLSKHYKTGYYSMEYIQWRIKVFERDGYKCQGCQKIGGYLNAHHIKQFAYYPELRFVVDNGITLCKECHKLVHKNGNSHDGLLENPRLN